MLLGSSVSGELQNIILTENTVAIRVYDVYGMFTEDSVRVGVRKPLFKYIIVYFLKYIKFKVKFALNPAKLIPLIASSYLLF